MAAISGTIGLEKSTTENYIKLLEAVFLVYRLPAWGTTLGSRVTKHPKVHVVDSGVMAWLLSLTPEKIAQAAPAALTEYGHLLETFAVGEILKQASWSDAPVTTGHFRTEAGDKVVLSGVRSPAYRAMLHPFRSGNSLITAAAYLPACSHGSVRAKHGRSSASSSSRLRSASPAPILTAAAASDFALVTQA